MTQWGRGEGQEGGQLLPFCKEWHLIEDAPADQLSRHSCRAIMSHQIIINLTWQTFPAFRNN